MPGSKKTLPSTIWTVFACMTALMLATTVRSEDFRTNDGREYKNATVSQVEPDGIHILISSGIIKLYFSELPEAVQQKYHYDPAKAAAFSKSEEERQREIYKQTEETRKINAEKQNEYWTTHPEPQDPRSQGGSLHQKVWIDGTVAWKDKDGLFVNCSGKGREGYEGAKKGVIMLRGHPNFAMLANGDHVEVAGTATGTLIRHHRGGDVNVYQFAP